jgi:hypothetical protein
MVMTSLPQELTLITVCFERGGMPETPTGTQMAPESLNGFLMQPTHGCLSNKLSDYHMNGWLCTHINTCR